MQINIKFGLGDKAFMIIKGKVTEVFITGIEVKSSARYQYQDMTGKKYKIGDIYVEYTVSTNQISESDRKNGYYDDIRSCSSDIHATKAELAASLGLV